MPSLFALADGLNWVGNATTRNIYERLPKERKSDEHLSLEIGQNAIEANETGMTTN